MTLTDLLTECHKRGVRLSATPTRLHWLSATGAVDDQLRRHLVEHKPDLIELLSTTCPTCHRQLTDQRRQCWQCFERLCADCGRATGSAFVSRCIACGDKFNRNAGGWSDEQEEVRLAA